MHRCNWKYITPIFAGVLFLTVALPAYADMEIAQFYTNEALKKGAIVAAIFVPLSEWLVLKFLGGLSWLKSLVCTLIINIISFLVGYIYYRLEDGDHFFPETFAIAIICLILLYWHARNSKQYKIAITGGVTIFIATVFLFFLDIEDLWWLDFSLGIDWDIGLITTFLYCFGCSLAIEMWPARLFIPLNRVDRTLLWANIISYLGLLIVLFVVATSIFHFNYIGGGAG